VGRKRGDYFLPERKHFKNFLEHYMKEQVCYVL
jgi:hypothetical protein